MARQTTTVLIDDVDGGEATDTVQVSLDGVAYEIDLNDENAQKLRDEISAWTTKGRRVGGRARRGTAGTTRDGDTKVVRQWAQEHGYNVGDRGRIPDDIRRAYDDAH